MFLLRKVFSLFSKKNKDCNEDEDKGYILYNSFELGDMLDGRRVAYKDGYLDVVYDKGLNVLKFFENGTFVFKVATLAYSDNLWIERFYSQDTLDEYGENVDNSHRGLGTAIMMFLSDVAVTLGIDEIHLDSVSDAIEFYEKMIPLCAQRGVVLNPYCANQA